MRSRFSPDHPCPACGRQVEIMRVDVSSVGDPPGSRLIDGPVQCLSGCDPRFRWVVIALHYTQFREHCRERGWDYNKILYVNSDDARSTEILRGRLIRRSMLVVLEFPNDEIRSEIARRLDFSDLEAPHVPFPPAPRWEFVHTTQTNITSAIIAEADALMEETRVIMSIDAMRWIPGDPTP